jgi:hypothetical protein
MAERRKEEDISPLDGSLSLAIESTELPLPGHSDEPPKGVFAMAVAILWGVLAFATGFEAVVNFNAWLRPGGDTQDAIIAGVDLVLCFALGILAVILWKARGWFPKRVAYSAIAVSTSPSVWVAVVLVILVISALPQLQLRSQKVDQTPDEIAAAVVRALPKEIAGLRGGQQKPTSPLFVKNILVTGDAVADVDNRSIISADFETVTSGSRLRVFLDYSHFGIISVFNQNTTMLHQWSSPLRFPLSDLRDYYKEQPVSVVVIRRHRYVDNTGTERWDFRFGGANAPEDKSLFETNQKYRMRLVFADDDGKEQYYYFYITQQLNYPTGEAIRVMTQDERTNLTEWNAFQ